MAIVHEPSDKTAVLSERCLDYESTVPSGKIKPAKKEAPQNSEEEHKEEEDNTEQYSTLLIPQWFQPFYLMIKDNQPPAVTVKFVGTKAVTAHYKTPLGQIPVTVNAPDYEKEIAPLLEKFNLLATHILTA